MSAWRLVAPSAPPCLLPGKAPRHTHCATLSHAQATSRIRKNVTYFKVNYIVIMLLTLVLTFLANPSSLLVVAALMGGWAYVFVLRTAPLVIAGRTLSDREKLMAMAGVSVITVFFLTRCAVVSGGPRHLGVAAPPLTLTPRPSPGLQLQPTASVPLSVGTVLFSALSISCCVIALHGATRVPDDLFLEEQEVRRGEGRGGAGRDRSALGRRSGRGGEGGTARIGD